MSEQVPSKEQVAELPAELRRAAKIATSGYWAGVLLTAADEIETSRRSAHEPRDRHERRVVGHASGWQEQMDTCVCGQQWPCPRAVQPPGDDTSRLNWWFTNVLHVGGDEDDDESGSEIEYEARLCRTPDEFRKMIDAAMGAVLTKGEAP
jgi:hypothetical protein